MACPQGLHECPLDTGPVTTERVGSRRAWLGRGSTHAWPLWPSQLGTWPPPTKGTRNNITLGEECTSQPLAGTSCSSLQERPRLALAECVCTCVRVCLVTALSATSSSRDGGVLPTCLPSPMLCVPGSWAPHHNPPGGWSSELPSVRAPVGEPSLSHKPRKSSPSIHPCTHPLAVLFSSPKGGKGASPTEGGCRWLFPCHWPFAACFTRRVLSVFA